VQRGTENLRVGALSLDADRRGRDHHSESLASTAMHLEYLEDAESQTPRVLLAYGDDPRDATVLRRAAEALAAAEEGHEVRVDQLPRFDAVDGCSLSASVGSVDAGVEPLDGSDRAFCCVLLPPTWKLVSELLEPFESADLPPPPEGLKVGARFQYLSETGPVKWIISTERGW